MTIMNDLCCKCFFMLTVANFQACASLDPNYQPDVTFVVIQKCHHTRLFASTHGDKSSVDGDKNGDFHLNSCHHVCWQ